MSIFECSQYLMFSAVTMNYPTWYLSWFVFVLTCIALTVWIRFRRSRYWQLGSKIPGPKGYPLVGNTLHFAANYKNILVYIKNLAETHGRVLKGWLGHHLLVCVSDPVDARIVLTSPEALDKNFFYKPLNLVWGNGLITARREKWKIYRKMMNPTFCQKNLENFVSVFDSASCALLDAIHQHADGTPVDLSRQLSLCTLGIVNRTLLGNEMDLQSSRGLELVDNLFPVKFLIPLIMLNPIHWFDASKKISPVFKKYLKLHSAYTKFAENILEQKSQNIKNISFADQGLGNVNQSTKPRECFVDHMLAQLSTQSGTMTTDELVDQLITIIIAGIETSVLTLCTVLMLLGLHPDEQARVVEEQRLVFRDDPDRPVGPEDLRRMVYLEQVVKEALRLFPVVPLVVRRCSRDLRITTHTIPAGSSIAVPIFVMHRDPGNFADPERFWPERFGPGGAGATHQQTAFMPFSAGKRNCIGGVYAMMLVKTVLSRFLRRYELLLCGSREAMESWDFGVILVLKNGYDVRFVPRQL